MRSSVAYVAGDFAWTLTTQITLFYTFGVVFCVAVTGVKIWTSNLTYTLIMLSPSVLMTNDPQRGRGKFPFMYNANLNVLSFLQSRIIHWSYAFQWAEPPSPKYPFPCGIWTHPIGLRRSLCPPAPPPQTALGSVQLFLQSTRSCPIDGQTDRDVTTALLRL